MPIDNSMLIMPFVPDEDDGEHFIYTEMLDRSQRSGNNSARLLKTFYHRSKQEFRDQLPLIKQICEMGSVRACTRLSTRSWTKVGQLFTKLTVEAAIDGDFMKMKSLYNKALGNSAPTRKLWIWDIDQVNEKTMLFRDFLQKVHMALTPPQETVFLATIPSKSGLHYITRPFDVRIASDYMRIGLGIEGGLMPNGDMISLHKDTPTNLYIPDSAA